MSITKINADVMDLGDDYTFTGSVGGAGKALQIVYADSYAFVSTTAGVPFDDTIMQKTEGAEFITLAITPTASDSILKIEFNGSVNGDTWHAIGLFQDDTSDALFSSIQYNSGAENLSVIHLMTAGTTSSTTFKIRAGGSGTAAINGNTSKKGGDIPHTTLVITEYGA